MKNFRNKQHDKISRRPSLVQAPQLAVDAPPIGRPVAPSWLSGGLAWSPGAWVPVPLVLLYNGPKHGDGNVGIGDIPKTSCEVLPLSKTVKLLDLRHFVIAPQEV